MNADRTVHATLEDGSEVVRYERAGKYYVEKAGEKPRHVTLGEAVRLAALPGTRAHVGRVGGTRFDAAYRKVTKG